jgi:hypothetical protein
LLKKKNGLFWVNTIKSNNISFMPICLTLFAKISILRQEFTGKDLIACILIAAYLIVQFIICVKVLLKNRDKFDDPAFIEKHGAYMKGLRHRGFLYAPIVMVLKLSFIVIPILMHDQGNQIQVLLFVQSVFIIWYGIVEPHSKRSEYRLMMFNQGMQMTIYYHLIVFSEFVLDPEIKFNMGYSLLAFIASMISVNFSILFRK